MSYIRKVSTFTLVLLALLALSAFLLVNSSVRNNEWYRYKIIAAQSMKRCQEAIKDEVLARGLVIDAAIDPNSSGLIGPEYSSVVTDVGVLDVKLMATNPNLAAVVVDLFKRAGLRPGDAIAVSYTGSLVGANIAVLSAAQAMRLNAVIVASAGSSSFGATYPQFTWLDMEKHLHDKGLIKYRSVAASLGGKLDLADGVPLENKESLKKAILRNGLMFLEEKDMEKNVAGRLNLYASSARAPIKAYINVGGGHASMGSALNARFIPTGLSLQKGWGGASARGVIAKMAQEGIPVINILKIRELMLDYGMPLLPVPLPEPGEGNVYFEDGYSLKIAILVCALFFIIMVILVEADLLFMPDWRRRIESFFRRQK